MSKVQYIKINDGKIYMRKLTLEEFKEKAKSDQ